MKNFDSIKFKMAAFRLLFTLHGRYLVNRARWLDHYYKTNCDFSGEDAQLISNLNGQRSG